jgi:hypothetical protein
MSVGIRKDGDEKKREGLDKQKKKKEKKAREEQKVERRGALGEVGGRRLSFAKYELKKVLGRKTGLQN